MDYLLAMFRLEYFHEIMKNDCFFLCDIYSFFEILNSTLGWPATGSGSQPRKFCDVCKCWLADNKASIDFNERGKSHREKKEKQISELRKRSQKEYKNQQKAGQYLKQMEEAAMKKYREDLREQWIELPEAAPEPAPEMQKFGRRNHYGWVNS